MEVKKKQGKERKATVKTEIIIRTSVIRKKMMNNKERQCDRLRAMKLERERLSKEA